MKTKWWRSEFKVGLMTIVGLALLFILLIWASDWRFGGHKVRIRFGYVGGLLKNAPVHIYGVEMGKVVSVKLIGLLFSVELKYQVDLDKGNISEDLRQEFERNEISLSQNLTVSIKEKNSEWLITDKDNKETYSVRKEKDELNIYLIGDAVEVTAQLRKEVPIREGYQVLIDILGLVGEKYIEIINGPAGNPITKDDPLRGTNPISIGHILTNVDEITSKTAKTMDFVQNFVDTNERGIHAGVAELRNFVLEARDTLRKTMGDVDVLLARVNRLTEAAEGDLGQTMASLKALAEGLNSDREEISSLIRDVTDDLDQLVTRTTPAIEESVGNFQKVSENLRASTIKASQHMDDLNKSISQLMAQLGDITTSSDQKLRKGLDDFGSSAAALNEIADRIDGLVMEIESGQGTLGKLITDETGYKRFDETMAAGKRAVEDVNSITRSLNHKLQFFDMIDTRKRYELSYSHLSRSLQNQFMFSLARSNPYFYIAGLSVREGKLTYDLQVGRKFGDLMARAGSIRSKAGIGLDYWPFSRHIGISLEGVDVTDRRPELGLDVAVRLFGGWYFIFGAEDLAGSEIGLNFGFRTVFGD